MGFLIIFSRLRWPIEPKFSRVCYFIYKLWYTKCGPQLDNTVYRCCAISLKHATGSGVLFFCFQYIFTGDSEAEKNGIDGVSQRDINKALQLQIILRNSEVIAFFSMIKLALSLPIHTSLGFTSLGLTLGAAKGRGQSDLTTHF